MATCPSCGQKSPGWFKPCGICEQENKLLGNLKSKTPVRPIAEPKDKAS
jgi:predicted ATP-dependent serine protease